MNQRPKIKTKKMILRENIKKIYSDLETMIKGKPYIERTKMLLSQEAHAYSMACLPKAVHSDRHPHQEMKKISKTIKKPVKEESKIDQRLVEDIRSQLNPGRSPRQVKKEKPKRIKKIKKEIIKISLPPVPEKIKPKEGITQRIKPLILLFFLELIFQISRIISKIKGVITGAVLLVWLIIGLTISKIKKIRFPKDKVVVPRIIRHVQRFPEYLIGILIGYIVLTFLIFSYPPVFSIIISIFAGFCVLAFVNFTKTYTIEKKHREIRRDFPEILYMTSAGLEKGNNLEESFHRAMKDRIHLEDGFTLTSHVSEKILKEIFTKPDSDNILKGLTRSKHLNLFERMVSSLRGRDLKKAFNTMGDHVKFINKMREKRDSVIGRTPVYIVLISGIFLPLFLSALVKYTPRIDILVDIVLFDISISFLTAICLIYLILNSAVSSFMVSVLQKDELKEGFKHFLWIAIAAILLFYIPQLIL